MRSFGAVAWRSFAGALREPALLVAVLAALCLLALAQLGMAFGFREQQGLVRDIGLSTIFLGGILAAMVAGTQRESDALRALVMTRPIGPAAYFLGGLAGAALAGAVAAAAIACMGAVLLRDAPGLAFDGESWVYAAAAGLLALGAGAWRSFRGGRSFSSGALGALCVLSAAAACVAFARAPGGGLRAALSDADVLLLQAEVLTLCAGLAVLSAVWSGSMLLGRPCGILAGGAVIVLGQVKESFGAVLDAIPLPLGLLVPNFQLVWGGDFFYGDITVLPWSFVARGAAALCAWAAGAALLGLTCFPCRSGRGVSALESGAG